MIKHKDDVYVVIQCDNCKQVIGDDKKVYYQNHKNNSMNFLKPFNKSLLKSCTISPTRNYDFTDLCEPCHRNKEVA